MTTYGPGGRDGAPADDPTPAGAGSTDVFQFLTAFREAAVVPETATPALRPLDRRPERDEPTSEEVVAPPAAARVSLPAATWIPPISPISPISPAGPAGVVGPADPAGDAGAQLGRRRLWERLAMAGVLVATAAALSLVAVHNNDAAAKWRRLDLAQVRISTQASQQIKTANANITQLNGEVKSLDGQVSSTQSQLASVANQKEKALDQTTVFKDLLAAAGQVADNLQSCIGATNQLDSDVNTAVASGDNAALGPLESEAAAVAATCARAQQGNQALQAAIQSAS